MFLVARLTSFIEFPKVLLPKCYLHIKIFVAKIRLFFNIHKFANKFLPNFLLMLNLYRTFVVKDRNRMSSERHQVYLNGRVASEEGESQAKGRYRKIDFLLLFRYFSYSSHIIKSS